MCTCSRFVAPNQSIHAPGQKGALTGSCKNKTLQIGMLGDKAAVEGGCQRNSSCLKVLLEVIYGLRHRRNSTKHPGAVFRTAVAARSLHCMIRRAGFKKILVRLFISCVMPPTAAKQQVLIFHPVNLDVCRQEGSRSSLGGGGGGAGCESPQT